MKKDSSDIAVGLIFMFVLCLIFSPALFGIIFVLMILVYITGGKR